LSGPHIVVVGPDRIVRSKGQGDALHRIVVPTLLMSDDPHEVGRIRIVGRHPQHPEVQAFSLDKAACLVEFNRLSEGLSNHRIVLSATNASLFPMVSNRHATTNMKGNWFKQAG
jgi:hypothetical protein